MLNELKSWLGYAPLKLARRRIATRGYSARRMEALFSEYLNNLYAGRYLAKTNTEKVFYAKMELFYFRKISWYEKHFDIWQR